MKIEKIDLILNTIDNGVIILDENLDVLFWNMWLESRTNITKEDIISKNLIDFYPNIKIKTLQRKIKTSLALNSPTFYNAENNAPLLPIEQSKITQKIFDSMQESITIVPYDIEKKLVCVYIYDDTRLSEQNHRLQQLTKQLEHEIEDSKRKDKKIIEQTQLAIVGEMIGNIAHHWRQPLNTISTAVTGLSIKNDLNMLKDDDITFFRNAIMDSTNYLSDTIDIFAKFVNHSLEIEPINVNNSIDKTVKILEGSFTDNYIYVNKNYEDDFIVLASNSELAQVFLNILTNAKDFFKNTEENYRFIDIKSYKKDDNVVIEIIDTAGGIDEKIKSKIYEPYFTTKHQSQGTGLGLHIVYKLVTEVMKGTIDIDNTTSIYKKNNLPGTKVTITLPLYKGKDND